MDRLTGKMFGRVRLVGNQLTPCSRICTKRFCENCPIQKAFDKLAHYEDLEEQGLLLKLPCKIGDTLWDIFEFVDEYDHPEMYVVDATKIEISKDDKGIVYCIDGVDFRGKEFGKTVFASKEEAEKKLAEMEKEN